MTHSGDIEARGLQIYDLVGNGEYLQAIRRLIDLARDFGPSQEHQHEAIIISGEFSRFEEEKRKSVRSEEENTRIARRLLFQALQLKEVIITKAAMPGRVN